MSSSGHWGDCFIVSHFFQFRQLSPKNYLSLSENLINIWYKIYIKSHIIIYLNRDAI
jgi:hypothetical protein